MSNLHDPADLSLVLRPTLLLRTFSSYTRQTLKTRPNLSVALRFADLTGATDDPLIRYWEFLHEARREDGIVQFAFINNLLLQEELDQKAVHSWLHKTFLDPLHAPAITALSKSLGSGDDPPDAFVAFHRLNCLLVIRTLLGREEQPWETVRDDNALIGDLALLANDFLKIDRATNTRLDTIVQFLPEWEQDNRTDIGNSIGRLDLMLRKHLCGADPKITSLRNALPLDVSQIDGLSIESYMAIAFATFAITGAVISKGATCVIDPQAVCDALQLPYDDVALFFKHRSLSGEEHRRGLSGDGWTREQLGKFLAAQARVGNVTKIRQWPFLRLDDGRVVVLDVGFVVDLLSSGIYWTHHNVLERKDRERFADLWGRVFELYVAELLEMFYAKPASSLIRPPTILHSFLRYGDIAGPTEVDAILDRGRTMILCEIKSSRLDLNAKLSRDPLAIEKEVRRKFVENEKGKPKAVRQLARTSDALLSGGIPGLVSPEYVYPVLVAEERSLESFEMNGYLNEIFETYRNPARADRIRPLTTMSVDELEQVLPYLADETVSWEELLESRFDGPRVRALSVGQALFNLGLSKPLEPRVNIFLHDRFNAAVSGFYAPVRDADD